MAFALFGKDDRTTATLGDDPVVVELTDRLHSLHDHCLTNLVAGLDAMRSGDLTVAVEPKTTEQVASTSGELAGYAAELDRLVGAFSV